MAHTAAARRRSAALQESYPQWMMSVRDGGDDLHKTARQYMMVTSISSEAGVSRVVSSRNYDEAPELGHVRGRIVDDRRRQLYYYNYDMHDYYDLNPWPSAESNIPPEPQPPGM